MFTLSREFKHQHFLKEIEFLILQVQIFFQIDFTELITFLLFTKLWNTQLKLKN